MEQESTVVVINEVDSLVQYTQESTVVAINDEGVVVVQQDQSTVVTNQEQPVVVSGFIQGIAGPPGQDYTFVPVLAQENINGHRAINVIGIMSNFPFVGISTGSATAGEAITVQQTGFITHSGWAWTAYEPIYATDNGILTQSVPLTGRFVIVGYGVTSTKMFIKHEPSILLG